MPICSQNSAEKLKEWASAQYKILSAHIKRGGIERSFKSTPEDFRAMLRSISQGTMKFEVCRYTKRVFGLKDDLCYRVQDRILHRNIDTSNNEEQRLFLELYNKISQEANGFGWGWDRSVLSAATRRSHEGKLDFAVKRILKWYSLPPNEAFDGGFSTLNAYARDANYKRGWDRSPKHKKRLIMQYLMNFSKKYYGEEFRKNTGQWGLRRLRYKQYLPKNLGVQRNNEAGVWYHRARGVVSSTAFVPGGKIKRFNDRCSYVLYTKSGAGVNIKSVSSCPHENEIIFQSPNLVIIDIPRKYLRYVKYCKTIAFVMPQEKKVYNKADSKIHQKIIFNQGDDITDSELCSYINRNRSNKLDMDMVKGYLDGQHATQSFSNSKELITKIYPNEKFCLPAQEKSITTDDPLARKNSAKCQPSEKKSFAYLNNLSPSHAQSAEAVSVYHKCKKINTTIIVAAVVFLFVFPPASLILMIIAVVQCKQLKLFESKCAYNTSIVGQSHCKRVDVGSNVPARRLSS